MVIPIDTAWSRITDKGRPFIWGPSPDTSMTFRSDWMALPSISAAEKASLH